MLARERLERYSKRTIIIVSILIILFLLTFGYATFFYYKNCDSEACFFNYLKDCNRASFSRTTDLSFEYLINGYSGGKCVVSVNLISDSEEFKLGEFYKSSSMVCKLPFGQYGYPEADLSKCTGLLKEGFQEVFVNRLKTEVVNNVGELNLRIENL